MKTYRIATIPGDGIGKEVIPAGRQAMQVLAEADGSFAFEFQDFDWGGDYYRRHGVMMPADGLDSLRDKDAILFDSAGDPDIPDHITRTEENTSELQSQMRTSNAVFCLKHKTTIQ